MIRNSRWQLARDIQPLGSKVKMHSHNKMKTKSQNIFRRVGKEGTCPSRESNQPGVEKRTTAAVTFLEKHSDGNHAQEDLPAGPYRVTPTKKKEKK